MTAAFILGNGPTLPVDALDLLDEHFTIGVNRIWRTGFEPDVLMWSDYAISREIPEGISSITVTHCGQSQADKHLMLANSWVRKTGPRAWVVDGNSGTAAARWAISCGFSHVYLLGMGAETVDGASHFYGGDHYDAKPAHLSALASQLELLLDDLGDLATVISSADELRAALINEAPIDNAAIRVAVLEAIDTNAPTIP